MVGLVTELCTLIDVAYVSRFLALHRSMARHGSPPRFLVCCWDAKAQALIDRLGLPGVTTMPMSELEEHDPELAALRAERPFRAYRAGAKPCLCRYVLECDRAVDAVAYLDADLMFFADPSILLDELQEHSILLVPQRHPPDGRELDETFGLYQAGTVGFRRGVDAAEALAWWRARCLEWCSLEPEPGRWADQRYLQDWPQRFGGVRVLDDVGIGPAPWNAGQYRFRRAAGRVLVDDRPLVFYHYSGLSLCEGSLAELRLLSLTPGTRLCREPRPLGWSPPAFYEPGRAERKLVWEPYVRELSAAVAAVREVDSGYAAGLRSARAQFAEVVLRKRLLREAMWVVRRFLDRRGLTRAMAPLDRLRKRWRVE